MDDGMGATGRTGFNRSESADEPGVAREPSGPPRPATNLYFFG